MACHRFLADPRPVLDAIHAPSVAAVPTAELSAGSRADARFHAPPEAAMFAVVGLIAVRKDGTGSSLAPTTPRTGYRSPRCSAT